MLTNLLQVLAIKLEWRDTINNVQKDDIFEMIQYETWIHGLIQYVFEVFDLEQIVGVGAAMRTAYNKNIPFWVSG